MQLRSTGGNVGVVDREHVTRGPILKTQLLIFRRPVRHFVIFLRAVGICQQDAQLSKRCPATPSVG